MSRIVFICLAAILTVALDKGPKKGSKFQPKGKEYIMVGYSVAAKGYRLYDAAARQLVEKRDVLFDEKHDVELKGDSVSIELEELEEPCQQDEPDNAENDSDASMHNSSSSESSDHYESAEDKDADVNVEERRGPGRPKIIRTGQPGRPKKQFNILSALVSENVSIPLTCEEALSCTYAPEWRAAMAREYDSLVANQTWQIVDLPKNQRAIGCKWVFNVKHNKDGGIERFKARLVAKGCSQKFGVNYTETFSPVCRLESVRFMIALAAELKLYLHQMDVCTAYLNSDLSETVYMKQPEGYLDEKNPEKVLLLKKAIYGLKQSGRAWNEKLNGVLVDLGFVACDNEPCLYKQSGEGNLSLILVYVDDLIIACQTQEDLVKIKAGISKSFECTDKGPLNHFLGMEIERQGDLGDITLGHSQYIKDLLRTHGIENCRTAKTPLDAGFQVDCTSDHCKKVDPSLYQSIVGELMWLALTTRPDILHSVSKLAQRNQNPHAEHMAGIKHVLRYLASTVETKLHYRQCGQPFCGFVDADWAGDRQDRKSYTGYIYFLAGGPISWRSEKQRSVALSSTEAEYMALSSAFKEAIVMRRLILEIGCGDQSTPIIVYGDNLSAQELTKNPVHHFRTKHIDIRYHFVREVVKDGQVLLKYKCTNEMLADILTKNLPKKKHEDFTEMLNLY